MHHHEVATAGQTEIDMRFDTLRRAWPTRCCWYKYCRRTRRRSTARRRPSCPSRSSGTTAPACTCTSPCGRAARTSSTSKAATPASRRPARYYIGGMLKHAPALLRLHRPDHQLATGGWCRATRRRSTWSTRSATARPRSASRCTRKLGEGQAHRVPHPGPGVQPVPGLRAHADGGPGRHPEQDRSAASRWTRTSTSCPPRRRREIKQLPGSLEDVLDNLEKDHEFLLKGDVFTQDVIETWIEYKRKNEVDADPAASAPVGVRPLLRHLSTGPVPGARLRVPRARPSRARPDEGRIGA